MRVRTGSETWELHEHAVCTRACAWAAFCCTDGGGAEARSNAAHPAIPLAQRHPDDFPLQYRPILRACALSLPPYPPLFDLYPSFLPFRLSAHALTNIIAPRPSCGPNSRSPSPPLSNFRVNFARQWVFVR